MMHIISRENMSIAICRCRERFAQCFQAFVNTKYLNSMASKVNLKLKAPNPTSGLATSAAGCRNGLGRQLLSALQVRGSGLPWPAPEKSGCFQKFGARFRSPCNKDSGALGSVRPSSWIRPHMALILWAFYEASRASLSTPSRDGHICHAQATLWCQRPRWTGMAKM